MTGYSCDAELKLYALSLLQPVNIDFNLECGALGEVANDIFCNLLGMKPHQDKRHIGPNLN